MKFKQSKNKLLLGASFIALSFFPLSDDAQAQALCLETRTVSCFDYKGERTNFSHCTNNGVSMPPSTQPCTSRCLPPPKPACVKIKTPNDKDGGWNVSWSPAGCKDEGCCFIAGTKITMADGSLKNIENIVVGDQVLGFNEAVHTVTYFTETTLGERSLLSINKGPYCASYDHVFKSKDGWVSANPEVTAIHYQDVIDHIGGLPDKMQVGTILIGKDDDIEIKTLDLKSDNRHLPLYDLNVTGDQTYIANDFVVHNGGHGSGGSM
jgi:hypothetical protein